MANIPVHRCLDRECPYFGQVTDKGCLCHKTAQELLVDQRDCLLAALNETVLQLQYLADKFGETGTGAAVLARVQAAIAKAEAA